jgi:hypothetical protein
MDPQKAAYERKQALTEGKVSHMTDGRVSQEAGSHILNKAKVSHLTEGKVSQNAWSHRRQSLTDGKVSQDAGPDRWQGPAY